MNGREAPAPFLIFTYGNPSRGDDALGPAMFELLEQCKQDSGLLNDVDLLTDFQLQIEHAIDFENRQKVLFVDASVSCAAPYECHQLVAQRDDSYTTHAMSPASVLAVYKHINKREPPAAYLLTIRGYKFGLGEAMSKRAEKNLQCAYRYILDWKHGT